MNNQRNLKFRLWDKLENKFFEPVYEAHKGNLLDISITLSGELLMRTLQEPASHESMFPGRFIIQQYTGLLDKNGTEIYEGDIIKDWNGAREVKFEIFDNYQGYDIQADDTDIEILGNIYQNSDLLKD